MKIKSFAILTLLAASFAYVVPAMADDMTNTDQSSQSSQSNQAPQAMDQSSQQSGADNTAMPSNGSGESDQNTPDTATGDDDY
jgi:hypothetical protein